LLDCLLVFLFTAVNTVKRSVVVTVAEELCDSGKRSLKLKVFPLEDLCKVLTVEGFPFADVFNPLREGGLILE